MESIASILFGGVALAAVWVLATGTAVIIYRHMNKD